MPGGGAPAIMGRSFAAGSRFRSVYVAAWLKFSPAWQGHASGANKMLYLYLDDGSPKVYTAAQGIGDDPLRFVIALQALATPYLPHDSLTAATTLNLYPNLNITKRIVRGEWHRYEILLTTNSAGAADGTVESWLDGVPQHSFTGIRFADAVEGTRWAGIQWAPVWGGVGDLVLQPMYQRLDHLLVSGR
jgi:hypothetical protein